MTRRESLKFLLAAGIWTVLKDRADGGQPASMKDIEALQKNWKVCSRRASGAAALRVTQTFKEEWRKRLDATQFNVLREEGTERPGSSPLNNEKRPGIFVCIGCTLPLLPPR